MTDQRLAVVTGASSGISEATARRFAARGYVVLLSAYADSRTQNGSSPRA